MLWGLNAVQRSASGEQSAEDAPAAACSVVPSASSPLSAECILSSGSGGANSPPPAHVCTDTWSFSYLFGFVPLRGAAGKVGGWGGWLEGAVLSRVFSLPQRNLESALRRLAANWDGFVPDVCGALPPSTPTSLSPSTVAFNGCSALMAAACRTLSSSVNGQWACPAVKLLHSGESLLNCRVDQPMLLLVLLWEMKLLMQLLLVLPLCGREVLVSMLSPLHREDSHTTWASSSYFKPESPPEDLFGVVASPPCEVLTRIVFWTVRVWHETATILMGKGGTTTSGFVKTSWF